MKINQLTIYGAGLIGGSIALSARSGGFCERIVAIDQAKPGDSAQESIFDDWAIDDNAQESALRASDLTVLCVPVRTIVEILPKVLDLAAGVVTDCGSTKQSICQAVEGHAHRARFVAGHPMAGHPVGGLTHASADLFRGRRWIVCPQHSDADAVKLVDALVDTAGAEAIRLEDKIHDASVAWTSHLPQVMASALAVYAEQHHALQAAGPGFASATRVAGGAEAMWSDIFSTNAEAIGLSLSTLGEALQQLGADLQGGNAESTMAVLARARALRALLK